MIIKTGEWLNSATASLQAAGIPSARLDSIILLEDATGFSRSHILAHPELPLNAKTLQELGERLSRRKKFEPLAYIRGKIEFYGHTFKVNPDVLIPRPESESFINLLTKCHLVSGQILIDVGTGCGALAIAAKLKYPHLRVYATDISKKALKIAKENAKNLKIDITFINADLLGSGLVELADYILANLPYVPDAYSVTPDITYEPQSAVFAGSSGLNLITKLIGQTPKKLKKGGYLFIESLAEQQVKISNTTKQNGLELCDTEGLVQVFINR